LQIFLQRSLLADRLGEFRTHSFGVRLECFDFVERCEVSVELSRRGSWSKSYAVVRLSFGSRWWTISLIDSCLALFSKYSLNSIQLVDKKDIGGAASKLNHNSTKNNSARVVVEAES